VFRQVRGNQRPVDSGSRKSVMDEVQRLTSDSLSDFIRKVPEEQRQNVADILCDEKDTTDEVCIKIKKVCPKMDDEDGESIRYFRQAMIVDFGKRMKDLVEVLTTGGLTAREYFDYLYLITRTLATTHNVFSEEIDACKGQMEELRKLLSNSRTEREAEREKLKKEKQELEERNKQLEQEKTLGELQHKKELEKKEEETRKQLTEQERMHNQERQISKERQDRLMKCWQDADAVRQKLQAESDVDELPQKIRQLEDDNKKEDKELTNAQNRLTAYKAELKTSQERLKQHESVKPDYSDLKRLREGLAEAGEAETRLARARKYEEAKIFVEKQEELKLQMEEKERNIANEQEQWDRVRYELTKDVQRLEEGIKKTGEDIIRIETKLIEIGRDIEKKRNTLLSAKTFLDKQEKVKVEETTEERGESSSQQLLLFLDQCYQAQFREGQYGSFWQPRRLNVAGRSENTVIFPMRQIR
jgi:hypothetical protein